VHLTASATLTGGYSPSGSITFTLTGPSNTTYTETDPVNSNRTASTSGYLPTAAGSYQWVATYSGDSNNSNASTPNSAAVTVSQASPGITSAPGGAVVIGTGAPLTASATLAAGYGETGAITFTLYNPGNVSVYTDVVTVTGNGTYNTSAGSGAGSAIPTLAGAYQWVAAYSGDSNNTSISTLRGATPEIAVSPGSTLVGTTLFLVGGAPASNTSNQLTIRPLGASATGSTGIQVQGRLNGANVNLTYTSPPTLITFVGSNGNDAITFDPNLTIAAAIHEGNGNDTIQLGQANNTVTLGNGNDNVLLGAGNNIVTAGNGNDNVIVVNAGNNSITLGNGNDNVLALGAGNNTITLGNGNDNVQAGNAALPTPPHSAETTPKVGNEVVSLGNGNDNLLLGQGDNSVTLGKGNDNLRAGNGNNSVIVGNGNDITSLGDGNNLVVEGNGNDLVQVGNGDNLIVGGLGKHTIQVGNGSNILIDGSVQLSLNGDTLAKVLSDWMQYGSADAASLRARLHVTDNTSDANTLTAGSGRDWFWETDAQDHTNRKVTDLLN
jgi:Ca2+-binding RTX toxin-like protein